MGHVSRSTREPPVSLARSRDCTTEADSDNPERRVDVEFRPPTFDEPVRKEFEVPEAAIGKFPGFAFFDIEVNLPVDGRWLILVSGGAGTISIPPVIGQDGE